MKKYKIILIFFILTFCFGSSIAMEKNSQIINLNEQQEKIFEFKKNEKELLENYIKKENFENDIKILENEINEKLKIEIEKFSNPAVAYCSYKKNLKYKNISKLIFDVILDSEKKTTKNVNIRLIFKNYYFLKENNQIQNIKFSFSKCEKNLLKQYIKNENFENDIKELEEKINILINKSFDTGYINYFKNINEKLLNIVFRVYSSFDLKNFNPLNLNENKNNYYLATLKLTTTICCNFKCSG